MSQQTDNTASTNADIEATETKEQAAVLESEAIDAAQDKVDETSAVEAKAEQADAEPSAKEESVVTDASEQAADEKAANADAQVSALESADTENSASEESDKPKFKIGDDVSSITGRPHITPEENAALAKGNLFFHKAMDSAARARGEAYEPFRLPPQMRAALAQIDKESAAERLEEAKKEALERGESIEDLKLEQNAIESLHKLNDEEYEQYLKMKSEKESIANGGARFYGRYQEMLRQQEERKAEAHAKVMRNIKILGVVVFGLIGYMVYGEFFMDRQANSIEELKAALPLTIDAHTTMVRIDDRNDDFKIYFEKDPQAFAELTEPQKDAALDQFEKNAPALCKNRLLHGIIASGRKVTVLLEATDRSFFREFSVSKCPSTEPTQSN